MVGIYLTRGDLQAPIHLGHSLSASEGETQHEDASVIREGFDRPEALQRFQMGRPDLGYKAGTAERPAWSIKDGALVARDAHNATLWLKDPLPEGDVKISFIATAHTKEGDVKVELFGDGLHHQSGYILINGGWKNSMRIIARQDEHGEDRREDRRCGIRRDCAPQGEAMRWVIERRGDVISWYLNGALALRSQDNNPIRGRYLGFGNWAAEVSFDQLKIIRLE